MADNEQKPVGTSSMEANWTLIKSLMRAQERNLKYTQGLFESTITLLKEHTEVLRTLLEQWGQQVPKPKGGSGVAENSASFLYAPLSVSEQVLKMMQELTRQGMESFENAGQSVGEVVPRISEKLKE